MVVGEIKFFFELCERVASLDQNFAQFMAKKANEEGSVGIEIPP